MDDEFGSDADFLALAGAVEKTAPTVSNPPPRTTAPSSGQANTAQPPKVTQPTPQAIARPSGPNSILVSPRQKGNPVLAQIKGLPWEYSDTIADYVLGTTTCALFLSLKYHRLHPEYVYQRIKQIAGKFNLRVLLTMVDIDNHEEPLRELAKTSMVNNLTLILAWSAREAARYLEAYKALEHAAPTAIRGQQSMTPGERMVEFVTVPRGINKADAVSLVSAFGSMRAAVNARKEEIASVQGWGEVKVRRWHESVREPFRMKKTAKKKGEQSRRTGESIVPIGRLPTGISREVTQEESVLEQPARLATEMSIPERSLFVSGPDDEEEDAVRLAVTNDRHAKQQLVEPIKKKPRYQEPEITDSMKVALAKYRN